MNCHSRTDVRQSQSRNKCVSVPHLGRVARPISGDPAWRPGGVFRMSHAKSANSPYIQVVESSSADLRLADARAFVARHSRSADDVHIVGATRGAVDDLVRGIAAASGATVGLHRFSLTHLAVRLAAPVLAADGDAPSTYLGSEAVAARAAFDAQQHGDLSYFAPVARMPGFARALSRTLQELRFASVKSDQLAALPLG